MSAASVSVSRSGSGASRMLWSTATATSIRRRRAAVSPGSDTVVRRIPDLRRPGPTPARPGRLTRHSNVHWRHSGSPRRAQRPRTASTRARSSGSDSGCSATRTAAVAAGLGDDPDGEIRGTAGTVTATGTRPRTGSGQPTVLTRWLLSANGPPGGRRRHGRAELSQPWGPSISMPSHTMRSPRGPPRGDLSGESRRSALRRSRSRSSR